MPPENNLGLRIFQKSFGVNSRTKARTEFLISYMRLVHGIERIWNEDEN
jgi:hypothetical protein